MANSDGQGDSRASVTMEDVARAAGVSRALVSKAFRGKGVSEASRAAIFAAADQLGYRHNRLAASLASQQTDTIGFFFLDLYNEVFADIYTGPARVVERANKRIVLAIGDPRRGDGREAVESLLDMRVDAIVLAGTLLADEQLEALNRSTPLVAVTRFVAGIDSAGVDDRLGGRLATEHLVQLGHRRIAYISYHRPEQGFSYLERARGYADVLADAGASPIVAYTDFTRESAREAARELLTSPDRPTAIFAHNDLLALGVIEAAADLGLEVPRDLSIVGYDDIQVGSIPGIGLTTVNHRAQRLGEVAAEMALAPRDAAQQVARHRMFDPELIVRATTGPAPE
jgi:DNA-binding LacI/PurR family transcriptional regulator